MPFSSLSAIIHEFPDLRSVPNYRRLGSNPVTGKLALAVPFDFISVSGLDVDEFRKEPVLLDGETFEEIRQLEKWLAELKADRSMTTAY